MQSEIHDRLDASFDDYDIIGTLHEVPPHVVYEVIVDDQRAVYKADVGPTGAAGVEGAVMDLLCTHTTCPIPDVKAFGEEYFVATWHEHAPPRDGTARATIDWARAAGAGLAHLHQESSTLVDGYGRFELTDGELSHGVHTDWHDAALAYVRGHRSNLARFGHADLVDGVIEVLEDNPDAFEGAGGSVCCHGWATPEHVGVLDGEVACLLDFEHAIAGPGEFDYWRTVIPTFGPGEPTEAQQAFRTAYEEVRPFPAGFERRRPFYHLLNLIYFFESLHVQRQHDPATTAEKAAELRTITTDLIERLK